MQNQTKSNLFIWISFTIITAIIIGGVGLYYYFTFQQDILKNNSKNYSTGNNKTDDWKIFDNTELGLTFEYPQNWADLIATKRTGFQTKDGTIYYIDNINTSGFKTGFFTGFSGFLESKDYQDFYDYFDREKILFSQKIENGTFLAVYFDIECSPTLQLRYYVDVPADSNYKKFSIHLPYDFYTDQKIASTTSDSCDLEEPYTKIAKEIENQTYNRGTLKEKIDLYKKIVSTVKFYTPTIVPKSYSWETYKNDDYGFELQYPKEYNFSIDKSLNNFIGFNSNEKSTFDIGENSPAQFSTFQLGIETEKTNDTLQNISDDFIKKINNNGDFNYSTSETSVWLFPVKVIKKYTDVMGAQEYSTAIFKDNDILYKITTTQTYQTDKSFIDEIFDQIIASFRFIK